MVSAISLRELSLPVHRAPWVRIRSELAVCCTLRRPWEGRRRRHGASPESLGEGRGPPSNLPRPTVRAASPCRLSFAVPSIPFPICCRGRVCEMEPNNEQLLTVDPSARASMKNAASCDT